MNAVAWLSWFLDDWHQLVGVGLVVTLLAWIGLAARRAPLSSYLRVPVVAPILVLGGRLLMTGFHWVLSRAAVHAVVQVYLPLLAFPVVGLLFGRMASRPVPRRTTGEALIHSGPNAAHQLGQRAVQRLLGPSGQLTVAGLKIPLADELKHFKFIGTTGSGMSSAIRELLVG